MKKIILSIVVLLPMLAHAQFTKGDKVLGGYLEFNTRDQKIENEAENQYRSLSMFPNVGLFVNDHLELGGLIGFGSFYQHSEGSASAFDNTYKSQSLTAGLYAQRYYSISDKFLFAMVVQSNFSRGNNTSSRYDPSTGEQNDSKTLSYSINSTLRPTFLFFPSPQWGFRFSIASLNHIYNRNLSTDDKSNQFTLAYGGINLGVSYYLRKGE